MGSSILWRVEPYVPGHAANRPFLFIAGLRRLLFNSSEDGGLPEFLLFISTLPCNSSSLRPNSSSMSNSERMSLIPQAQGQA